MEAAKKNQSKQANLNLFGSFYIESTEFAINLDNLQEVVNFPERIIKIPLAPEFLLGVFNLRGWIIPVIDLRRLLNFENVTGTENQKVAIVEQEGVRVGLVFDTTGEVIRVNQEELNDFKYASTGHNQVVLGAIKLEHGGRLVQIIDPAAALKIENVPYVLLHQKKDEFKQARFKKEMYFFCLSWGCVGF